MAIFFSENEGEEEGEGLIIPKLQSLIISNDDFFALSLTLHNLLILHLHYFILKEQSEVRFSAIRWATTLYDTRHCSSRYICMIGASDVKLDIRLVTKDIEYKLFWHMCNPASIMIKKTLILWLLFELLY